MSIIKTDGRVFTLTGMNTLTEKEREMVGVTITALNVPHPFHRMNLWKVLRGYFDKDQTPDALYMLITHEVMMMTILCTKTFNSDGKLATFYKI